VCVALAVLSLGAGLSGCGSSSRTPTPLRYTALGASDAVGLGALPPTRGYVFRIRDSVEQQTGRRVELINLGIPGAEIRTIDEALQTALRATPKPDVVTVWTGPNDVVAGTDPRAFEDVLRRMLSSLREKTKAFVVIANVPDLTRLPRFVEHPSTAVTTPRILAFNTAIERQALGFNVPVVHLYEQPFMEHYVSDIDGFHPSNAGHAAIAELFLRVILPQLSPSRAPLSVAPLSARLSSVIWMRPPPHPITWPTNRCCSLPHFAAELAGRRLLS
jgi:lysophospholipase L1-like esterase